MNNIKLDYNEIIESYLDNLEELENDYSVIYALESDNIDPEENKKNVGEKILKSIMDILEKMANMIDTMMMKLKNRLNKLLTTDKGFYKEFSRVERDRKPLNGIKVINYKYVPEFLSAEYGKMKKMSNKLISEVTTSSIKDDSILLLDSKTFENHMLDQIGYKDNDTTSSYLMYVKKTFRGSKREITIMNTEIPKYKKNIATYQSAYQVLNNDLISLKSKINDIRAKTKVLSRNSNVSDEKKRMYSKQVKNLSLLYNFYSAFINIYFELTVENMLSSRAILRKFYQM